MGLQWTTQKPVVSGCYWRTFVSKKTGKRALPYTFEHFIVVDDGRVFKGITSELQIPCVDKWWFEDGLIECKTFGPLPMPREIEDCYFSKEVHEMLSERNNKGTP